MGAIAAIVALLVGLLGIGTHLANMADRNQKEGARKERIEQIFNKLEVVLSTMRGLENEVNLLKQKVEIQGDELKDLRKERREG